MAFQKPSHTFTKIHLKGLRTNSLHILFSLSFTVFINTLSFAQELPKKSKEIPARELDDRMPIRADSIINRPVKTIEIDTTEQDSIKQDEFLKDVVTYKASDYVAVNQKKQKIYLFN